MDYFKRLELPIAAAASARGGPLVVLRISGKNLKKVLSALHLSDADDRLAKYCNIFDIDYGLAIFFKSPKSFTGEDVIELHVHGSDRICESILEKLKTLEVVDALPGEFSFRAFMHEKMTLAEAESLHVALSQASSSALSSQLVNLSKHAQENTENLFHDLQTALTSARGRLESAIDFSEAEEEQANDVSSCRERLCELQQKLDGFLTAHQNFSFSMHEPRILIVGEPNSGKSTLLNLLLGSERSLVSMSPGTTRDYIEAKVKIQNSNYIFVDTAGIRGLEGEKIDDLEKRGINRALEFIKEAHAILWVKPSHQRENSQIQKLLLEHPLVIEIESFGDLSKKADALDLRSDVKKLRSRLEDELKKLHIYRQEKKLETFLSDRQVSHLTELHNAVKRSIVALEASRPYELVAEDLKSADRALKLCRGKELSNDYISEIFSQFCLGK